MELLGFVVALVPLERILSARRSSTSRPAKAILNLPWVLPHSAFSSAFFAVPLRSLREILGHASYLQNPAGQKRFRNKGMKK
jgi:hypothetical protein